MYSTKNLIKIIFKIIIGVILGGIAYKILSPFILSILPAQFLKITSLALVNSINPCQIAMLVLVLITILTENEEISEFEHKRNKKKVLLVGFTFTLAVFLAYLFYGMILVQLFNTFTNSLKENSVWIKDGFAILAMIIGALKIKDYFMYKPGNFGTEMPLILRPRARIWIKRITSPIGAFFIGFIITLFLAPCTITPLLVASESLSRLGLIGALPWLLYFNFIVVLPLFVITLIVYAGFTTAESVSQWKERNIKRMHLIAGLLLFGIGLVLLMGWI